MWALTPPMCRHLRTGLAMVRNGSVDAFITDAPTLQYFAGRQPCDLTVVGNDFGPGALVYGLQKNSSLTGPLNDAMLVVRVVLPAHAYMHACMHACIALLTQLLPLQLRPLSPVQAAHVSTPCSHLPPQPLPAVTSAYAGCSAER
jgi:hypothetical protein